MLKTIQTSKLFSLWQDPLSGVESWVLTKRVAPLQQSFYFTNPAFSADGRFLWFYSAFPPAGNANYGRLLAVLDFETDTATYFPETQFLDASPVVDAETAEVYWVSGLEIWKRSPYPAQAAQLVTAFPAELANNRRPYRLATHLTFSADRQKLNIDAQIGNEWFVGAVPLDGGPLEIWQRFEQCYNHGQFSPTDPDLQLIAQDWWFDANSGQKGSAENRLWLIRRGEPAYPLLPGYGSARQTHEWWDKGGQFVWYVDYDLGTERVNILSGERQTVWANGTCHSHCDSRGRYLVGDIGTYTWEQGCRVAFFNIQSGREVNLVSNLPLAPYPRSLYHTDPHPQFCLHDQYICYTTTVFGYVTVALTPVQTLLTLT
jgi:hypothetical protein